MNNVMNKEISVVRTLSKLWKYFPKKRKYQLLIIFLLILLSGMAEVFVLSSVVPFIQLITNSSLVESTLLNINILNNNGIITSSNVNSFITCVFIFSVLFASFVRILNLWVGGRFAASLGTDLSLMCYQRIINQPYEFHLNKNSSQFISLLAKEISSTVTIFAKILHIFASLIILIFLSSFLIITNWKIFTSASIAFVSIYLLLILNSKNLLSNNSSLITFLNSNQVKILQESVGSIRDIILNRLSSYYSKIYVSNEYKLQNKNAQNRFINMYPRYALEGISLSTISLAAYFLVDGLNDNDSIIPLLAISAIAVQKILPNFQLVYSTWTTIQSNKSALNKVLVYLERNSYLSDKFLKNQVEFKKSIELKNIYFKYNIKARKYTINNLNLLIKKGDRIGIIGESGSGKTTILDLINGLLKPTKGKIFIDNYDLHDKLNKQFIFGYRELISYVPQNIFLNDSTIAENIAFGLDKKYIDFSLVRKVSKIVELDDFIMSRPKKYNLLIGEKGVKLSGGQLQRIGLARALYKNSEIIFLDEATSALDNKTEKKIIESIKCLDKNITIIMIAHRLSSLKSCNKIFEIKDGKVIRTLEGNNLKLIN